MPHISSRQSKTLHPATNLSKLYTYFKKNVTTKTRHDRHSLLFVTTPQLVLLKRNYLLLPLPLPLSIMLFPNTWTADTYHPLFLASCLTTVLVRHPTKFVIPLAEFIPPLLGSCLNQRSKIFKPTTIILMHQSVLMPLPLPPMSRPSLTFLHMILSVEVQSLLPLMFPVNIPQACHLHYHITYHWRSLFHLHYLHKLTSLPWISLKLTISTPI